MFSMDLEMCKVVPVPPGPRLGPNFFWLGLAPKFFLNRTSIKMFFLDLDRDQNIFDWDRHQNLFLKGPRPKTFFRWDRDRDQNFFLAGTRTGVKFFFSPGPEPLMTGPAYVYMDHFCMLVECTLHVLFLLLMIMKKQYKNFHF